MFIRTGNERPPFFPAIQSKKYPSFAHKAPVVAHLEATNDLTWVP